MIATARHQRVVARPAVQRIVRARPTDQGVVAVAAAQQLMAAGAGDQRIVAGAAIDAVVPIAADDRVIARAGQDNIIAAVLQGDEIVAAAGHHHHVVGPVNGEVRITRDVLDDHLERRVRSDGVGGGCEIQYRSMRIQRLGTVTDLHFHGRVVVMTAAVMAAVTTMMAAAVEQIKEAMSLIVVETAVVQKIINDRRSCSRIDVGRQQMIELSSIKIVRRHVSPLTYRGHLARHEISRVR